MSEVIVYEKEYQPLGDIEWDFAGIKPAPISMIHPYPARFISAIPHHLIKCIGCPDGSIVFDPFCGSGTTLYESIRFGRKAVGVDINPIACLISRVKTNPLNIREFEEAYNEVIARAHKAIGTYECVIDIPNIDHWFKPEIQKALSCLIYQSQSIKNKNVRNAFLLAISSVIVKYSNQESDTRYAAVDNSYTVQHVFDGITQSCKRIASCKKNESIKEYDAQVIEKNILEVKASEIKQGIGLVVTSPPYPNAYEYWLYHKYRMWWLGYDPIHVRNNEIGARPHYQKKNGQTADDFCRQMNQVFDLICEKLVINGHVCVVIGRSVIKGQVIDNSGMIENIASSHNLRLVANIERSISLVKKSFNPKYGKIKKENILVFRGGRL